MYKCTLCGKEVEKIKKMIRGRTVNPPADMFYEPAPGEERYLNQILLDQGLAERV